MVSVKSSLLFIVGIVVAIGSGTVQPDSPPGRGFMGVPRGFLNPMRVHSRTEAGVPPSSSTRGQAPSPPMGFERVLFYSGPLGFLRMLHEMPHLSPFIVGELRPVSYFLDRLETESNPAKSLYFDLTRAVETAVAAESSIKDPIGIWRDASGERLMRLASTDSSKRPHLIIPLIMLLTGLGIPPSEISRFAIQNGIVAYCESFKEEIVNVVITDHRKNHKHRKQLRLFEVTGSVQRFMTLSTFMADFPQFCPALFETSEMRLVSLLHSHFRRSLASDISRPMTLKYVKRSVPFTRVASQLARPEAGLGIGKIESENEIGDGKGAIADWFTAAGIELFDRDYGVFERVEDGNHYKLNSTDAPWEHPTTLRAAGAFLALSVIEEAPLGINIPLYLLNYIADVAVTLESIQEPLAVKNLQRVLHMSEDELKTLYLYIPETDEPVTMDNRHLLVNHFLESRLPSAGPLAAAYREFKAGFRQVIPFPFEPVDIQRALLGNPEIDVERLIRSIQLSGYAAEDIQVGWLFKLLRSWDRETMQKWLVFTTALQVLPMGGPEALQPPLTLMLIDEPEDRLPRAGTCFNQFKLPKYATEELMVSKILTAINYDLSMGLV